MRHELAHSLRHGALLADWRERGGKIALPLSHAVAAIVPESQGRRRTRFGSAHIPPPSFFVHTRPVNCGEKLSRALDCAHVTAHSFRAARPVTVRHAIGSWSGKDKAASLWREFRSTTRPPPGGTVRAQ